MNSDKPYTSVLITHGGCGDGNACAFAFTTAAAEYAQTHGDPPKIDISGFRFHFAIERDFEKDARMPDLTGKNVYITDYSYSRETMTKIAGIAKSVTIWDHHDGVIDNVTDIPGVTHIIDKSRCGAEITWDAIYGPKSRPWFIKHIRDRDLWEWQHPDSRGFSVMYAKKMTMTTLADYSRYNMTQINELYRTGNSLVEHEASLVERICRGAKLTTCGPHRVMFLQTTMLVSECGNKIVNDGVCDYVVIGRYDLAGKRWDLSLRSGPEIDVGEICRARGGGGHPRAAGFEYTGKIEELFVPVVEDVKK